MRSEGAHSNPRPPDPPTSPGLQAFRFSIGDDEFVLFELPALRPLVQRPLPRVEAEVLRLVLAGCSNAEIARARGRSPRTVANQVARLFEKMGVHSRMELVARVTSGCAEGVA